MSEDKILSEDDISMGFRSPLYSIPVCIPECNVCAYWDGPGKCKKIDTPPNELRLGRLHNCPDAVLDTGHFAYSEYQKLYPEECKQCKKR